MKEYAKKYTDPRWQKKRLEILSRDEFTCLWCKSTETQLHVHHRYYISKREPWEYPQFCFQTLCKDCHKRAGDPPFHDSDHHDATIWEQVINWFGSEDALLEVMQNDPEYKRRVPGQYTRNPDWRKLTTELITAVKLPKPITPDELVECYKNPQPCQQTY